jgi:hypothetical protein
MTQESWESYQKMVLTELQDLKNANRETQKEITLTRIEVEKLKVKSGIWGAAAGLLASVGVAVVSVFK